MDPKGIHKQIKNYIYYPQNKIGKGSSSVVYLGQNINTNQTVAIKVIDARSLKTDIERLLIGNQMKALKTMNHENVIRAIEIYQTANNIYIVYQYCELGDLQNYIISKTKLSEEESLQILLQLLTGVIHIHSKGVTHRDLKPQNIMLKKNAKDKIFKIIDFGFSEVNEPKFQQLYNVGSPLYMSPEVFKKNRYSIKSDCWALGMIFLEMLIGDLPFRGIQYDELVRKLSLEQPYKNMKFSQITKLLLSKMLAVQPQKRIQPAEALNILVSSKVQPLKVLGTNNQNVSLNRQNNINQQDKSFVVHKNQFQTGQRNIRGSVVMNHSPAPKIKHRDISPAKPLDKAMAYVKQKQTVPIQQKTQSFLARNIVLSKIKLCDYFYSFLCDFEQIKSEFVDSERVFLLGLKLIKQSLELVRNMFQQDSRVLNEEELNHFRSMITQFNDMQVKYSQNKLFSDLYFSFALQYLRLQYQYLNYLQFWMKSTFSQFKVMGENKNGQCPKSAYRACLYLVRIIQVIQQLKKNPNKMQFLPQNASLDKCIADKTSITSWEHIKNIECNVLEL